MRFVRARFFVSTIFSFPLEVRGEDECWRRGKDDDREGGEVIFIDDAETFRNVL